MDMHETRNRIKWKIKMLNIIQDDVSKINRISQLLLMMKRKNVPD